MKKLLILLIGFIVQHNAQAQKIDGLWYSSDSTRIYEISQVSKNEYQAIIKSSTRKTDSAGFSVIKRLEYNRWKKRYEGFIYAVSDGDAAFVKMKLAKDDNNKMILKLSRMFVLDVKLNWFRIDTGLNSKL